MEQKKNWGTRIFEGIVFPILEGLAHAFGGALKIGGGWFIVIVIAIVFGGWAFDHYILAPGRVVAETVSAAGEKVGEVAVATGEAISKAKDATVEKVGDAIEAGKEAGGVVIEAGKEAGATIWEKTVDVFNGGDPSSQPSAVTSSEPLVISPTTPTSEPTAEKSCWHDFVPFWPC